MTSSIAIATSIPPKISRYDGKRLIDIDYQRLCVHSWIACGFRVLSINDADEIAPLAALYPDVTFVPTERNASAISERKNPYIADLLLALDEAPEHVVGIVNSDIVLDPAVDWQGQVSRLAVGTVIVGQRCDTTSLVSGALRPFATGFDYFFFERSAIKDIIADSLPFALGLPCWDYWLPVMLALKGREPRLLTPPTAIHLAHDTAYKWQWWRDLSARFVACVASASGQAKSDSAETWAQVATRCRELAASGLIESGAVDEQLHKLNRLLVQLIHSNTVVVPENREAARHSETAPVARETTKVPTLERIFSGFTERLRAGQWLENAISLQEQGRQQEAEQLYRAVLSIVPYDWMALCSLGESLRQRGQHEEALTLFRKALATIPTAHILLNQLGSATFALGRRTEAVSYFARAVALDPGFALAHYNLAMAQYTLGRIPDALRAVERALALKRDLPGAAEAYYQLRQALPASRHLKAAPVSYYSQNGEDALLDAFFGFKSRGFFVDVGAFDGVHLSNSLAFERRGWSGICIEAAPTYYALCKKARPRSQCYNVACIAEDRGTVAFQFERGGLFSGVSPDAEFVARIHAKFEVPFIGMETIEVEGRSLDSLLGEDVKEIDFISIDVEGSELDVLAGFDLDRYRPRVLVLEANTDAEREVLDRYLEGRGYRLARSLAWNHFYVRDEADRRALRAVTVSAKLEQPSHPLGLEHNRLGYASPYVYWAGSAA